MRRALDGRARGGFRARRRARTRGEDPKPENLKSRRRARDADDAATRETRRRTVEAVAETENAIVDAMFLLVADIRWRVVRAARDSDASRGPRQRDVGEKEERSIPALNVMPDRRFVRKIDPVRKRFIASRAASSEFSSIDKKAEKSTRRSVVNVATRHDAT